MVSKEQQNKLDFINVYAGSTDNVIKSVLLGKADAGAVFVSDLALEPRDVREQLRVLVETRKVAPHPLCAHPRVPRAVRDAVKRAVLAIAATPEGSELVRKVRLPNPVPADYDKDYRSLEEIDVRGLTNWGE